MTIGLTYIDDPWGVNILSVWLPCVGGGEGGAVDGAQTQAVLCGG